MIRFEESSELTLEESKLYNEFILYCSITNDLKRMNEAELKESLKDIIEVIKEVAAQLKTKVKEIVQLFKNTKVFKFFASFKFNFKLIQDAFIKAHTFYKKVTNFLPDLATKLANAGLNKLGDTKSGAKIKAVMNDINEWLKKHKTVLTISGVVLGALLIIIWLNMSFIGDPEFDFGFENVIAAVTGKLTLIDFFSSQDGIKTLVLLATGLLGLSVPWFDKPVNIAISLIKTISTWLKIKLSKGTDSPEEISSLEKSLS